MKLRKILWLLLIILGFGTSYAFESPETVYANYLKAIKARNYDKMITYKTQAEREKAKKYPKSFKAQIVHMLQRTVPRSYTVINKKVEKKAAYLWLKGKIYDIMSNKILEKYGKINFVKEDTGWKIKEINWDIKPIP